MRFEIKRLHGVRETSHVRVAYVSNSPLVDRSVDVDLCGPDDSVSIYIDAEEIDGFIRALEAARDRRSCDCGLPRAVDVVPPRKAVRA